MANPNVAAGGTNRNPGQPLNPSQVAGAQGIAQSSLPVPVYSNPASGAQYNTDGGPQAPYMMPVQKATNAVSNVPFAPKRTNYKP